MKKLPFSSQELIDAVAGWTKDSDLLYVHASGMRIERRVSPDQPGWYLVSPFEGDPVLRFEPTIAGCDEAFVAFAGRRAATAYLSRLLSGADGKVKRAG